MSAAASSAAPIEPRAAVIDLVRGVSILLVILLHVQLRIPLQHTPLFEAAPTALWRLLRPFTSTGSKRRATSTCPPAGTCSGR